jgi:uncharacterized ion transporter superfamily protein YfcC
MKKIKSMFEKHDLVKIVLLAILVTIVLSWIIPYGYFSGSEFTDYGLNRQGLSDILLSGVYSANFFLQQLLFVAFIGIFYGIIRNVSGYKAMVSNIAKKFKGKEKLFVILSSLIITLLTTFLTQSFVVLLFIPLIINIASKLKLDKITAFLITFGSMLIGFIGATYGTEGLVYFVNYLNYYGTVEITDEILIRFGILALAFIVYNVFTLKHVKNVLASKKNEDKIEDLFEVENPTSKKVKVWPMAVFFILLFVFAVLGYVNWSGNFNITVFDDFHTWLTGLQIGDYAIISYVLGNNAAAFGSWDLYTITIVMAIIVLLSIFIYKVNFNELIDNAEDGLKKIIKPILLLLLVYVIFIIIYWSPFTVTISNWILKLADGFNPFLASLSAAVSSIFNIDFGYTGYVLGDVMVNYFGDSFNIAFVVYVAINGLVQVVAPTSVMVMLGLSYLDIPYKKWIKYIWKFFLIMLVLLLVIFALLTYL